MPDIDARVTEVEGFIRELQDRLRANPNDFGAKLSLQSWNAHASDLRMQRELELAEASKELVEVRLIGNRVRFGSIPLAPLSHLSGSFAKLINEAVLKLKFGLLLASEKAEKMSLVERLTDLRLAGIGEGSARLFVTGRLAPDLTGESPLDEVLRIFFGVLAASDSDAFYDLAHVLGPSSAKAMEQFMLGLDKYDLAADISWNAPTGERFQWEGRTDEISRVRALLEKVDEPEVVTEEVTAIVSLISDSGRIELRLPGEDRPRKVRYSRKEYPAVRMLKVEDVAVFVLERSTFFDKAQDKHINKFALVEVRSAISP